MFSFIAVYMLTVIMVIVSLLVATDSKSNTTIYHTAIVANSTVIAFATTNCISAMFMSIGERLVVIVRQPLLDASESTSAPTADIQADTHEKSAKEVHMLLTHDAQCGGLSRLLRALRGLCSLCCMTPCSHAGLKK